MKQHHFGRILDRDEIAMRTMSETRRRDRQLALMVLPDGRMRLADPESVTGRYYLQKYAQYLVGVYDARAKYQHIDDDLRYLAWTSSQQTKSQMPESRTISEASTAKLRMVDSA